MEKFLDRVAAYILQNDLDPEDLTIVLPSERSIKYMRSSLFKSAGKPLLSPEIVTIDRWIKDHSERTVIDRTRALLRLFEVHLKHAKTEKDRSFDEFLTWGNILLSDFDEIDRYLLNAKQVFKNLADIKELESWNIEEKDMTQAQKDFLEFWDRLPDYYYELNQLLEKDNICYAGSAFRYVSDNVGVLFGSNNNRKFVFAGFNALSPAEMSIMRQLDNMGRAHILIDSDRFYYDNNSHEAGSFLRKLSAHLDNKRLSFQNDELATKEMDIRVVECAQATGQVKVASTVLAVLSESEMNNTLLLLADESLISSMINNIPKNVGKANITLGLPIRNTAVKTWVELIINIQENKGRFNTEAIYYKDLQSLWRHPFLLSILDDQEKIRLNEEERNIVRYNRIFLSREKLKVGEKVMQILELLTRHWNNNWLEGVRAVRALNRLIYKELSREFAFEKALLESFDAAMMEFEAILSEGIPEMKMGSFKHLFNQHWTMKSVAYHGNPIDGLQIMGLLETRALDFERIICLGMNEGNLPPTNPVQTIIPMDLRKYLGLPTPREKQGLFAHHFYRLLHGCHDLLVTYSTAEDKMGGNEPSRYLAQLELELCRQNKNIKLTREVYSLITEEEKTRKEFEKTPETIARLDALFAKSTSASMLRKYLDCPLDFYFRYVMDFGEADDVEEEIENSTFGTFIHETLEQLYRPFARYDEDGNPVSPAPTNIKSVDVDRMLKNYSVILDEQFMKHFNGDKDAFTKGKNRLSYEMAHELTKRFLKSERKFLMAQTQPVFIESLESEYSVDLELEIHGIKKMIRLRGFIDRIDSVGGKIRIIDYKSGKVEDDYVRNRVGDKTSDDLIESMSQTGRKHVLQLMLYNYLYYKNKGVIPESGIISLVSGNGKLFKLNTNKIPMEQVVEEFPEYLQKILEDVYDERVPFIHEASAWVSYCKYCE